MKVYLDEGAFMPERRHPLDAGLDLRAPYSFSIYPGERKTIDTGVHIQLPMGFYGNITTKSSLSRDRGIVCQGVVDSSYRDSIFVVLVNASKQIANFEVGDTIAQLIIEEYQTVDVEPVTSLDFLGKTNR